MCSEVHEGPIINKFVSRWLDSAMDSRSWPCLGLMDSAYGTVPLW